MTVSTEVESNTYTGNGTTTAFPYTFRIFEKSDLVVTVEDTSGNLTQLTVDTDYTVSGAGTYSGGNVTLTNALANGYQIEIKRVLPITQETDLRNQGKFFPEVHEDAFDKLTMLIQQVWFGFTLALRKPSSISNYYDALANRIRNLADPSQAQDAATKNYVDTLNSANISKAVRTPESINSLPSASTRANTILTFDSQGQPTVSTPVSGSAADVLLKLISSDDSLGDALVSVKQPVTGAVLRTQHNKNYEEISVYDFGAQGNGTADDSTAFINANNASKPVFVPYGFYLLSSVAPGTLTNNFYGPGTVKYSDGTTGSFQRADQLIATSYPMRSPAAGTDRAVRSLVFIGDSITYGTGTGVGKDNAYPRLILDKIRAKNHHPMCTQMPFSNMDYISSLQGTVTYGTTGPLKKSFILAPGANINILAPFVDIVFFTYAQNSSNVTTVVVTDNNSSVVENYTTTTGTSKCVRLGNASQNRRGGPSCTVNIKNNGANPLEINGIMPVHFTDNIGIVPQVHAYPGYATADFNNGDVLDAIFTNTIYQSNFPTIVINLGTNDIYSNTVYVTPSVYRSNIEGIVSGLISRFNLGCNIILLYPLRPAGGSTTLGGKESEYRSALYSVARKYQCDVLDGSELNLNVNGSFFRVDNLHPNAKGHSAIAEWIFNKLEINSYNPSPIRYSFGTGITAATQNNNFGISVDKKVAKFNGYLTLTNTTPSYPVTLGVLPNDFALRPVTDKYLSVKTDNNGNSATVRISGATLTLLQGPSTMNYLFFDGVEYSLEF